MINSDLFARLSTLFADHFRRPHSVAAYAPGRVEVIGNHTDYNDGFVLSAAINFGTFFIASPTPDTECRLVAGDLMEEVRFPPSQPGRSQEQSWSNYVRGVLAKLTETHAKPCAFNAMFLGNIPLGAGLSSSAALETSAGLALCALFGIRLNKIELARIGQAAEHEFAGVRCGLLDQISSLYGKRNHLVMTDFRSLEVSNVPTGEEACFLMCNTRVKHSLVDSEYNSRRQKCEEAAAFFADTLGSHVKALRDVSWQEWEQHSGELPRDTAQRAAHVIGENTRVLQGRELLENGDLEGFGQLMFESHASSRDRFANSCEELDFLVDTAASVPGVLGARLSGGGFGGSVVVLTHPRDASVVGKSLSTAYEKRYGKPCEVCVIQPSDGADTIAS